MIKGEGIAVIGVALAIIMLLVGGYATFKQASIFADNIESGLSRTHTVRRGTMDSPSIVIYVNRTEFTERLPDHTIIYRSSDSFVVLEESNTIAYSWSSLNELSTQFSIVIVFAFGTIGLGVLLGVLRNTVWKDKK